MNNIERLSRHITQTKEKNILIHTIPGTSLWIICQAYNDNKWLLTLMDPQKTTRHTLGTITDNQHTELWYELINREIDIKTKTINTFKEAKRLRNFIKEFTTNKNSYAKFIKIEDKITDPKNTQEKTPKQRRTKLRKRHK